MAIRALGGEATGRRREALIPSFTFASAGAAAVCAGLHPVFADVEPASWHLDPQALRRALDRRQGRIAIVVACSSFGVAPPRAVSRAWEAACREAGVPLVVDSAAGFGARDESGRSLGYQGDAEVFSFHATKPLAVGEGGAVIARSHEVVERMRRLTNYGLDERRRLLDPPGINAKMSELAGAAGLAALESFDDALARRRKRAGAILSDVRRLGLEVQAGAGRPAWQWVPVLAPTSDVRSAVLREAACEGVELRTYYEPLHEMPAFEHAPCADDLETTRAIAGRILSLPMAADLSAREIARVVRTIRLGTRAVAAGGASRVAG